jgi:signal transduction histidine kinase
VTNVFPKSWQLFCQNALSWRALAITIGVAIAYAGTATLCLTLLQIQDASASPIWLPAGIALASVFLTNYTAVFGVMLGDLLLMQSLTPPPIVMVSSALGIGLQTAIGSLLLRRLGFSPALERLRDVASLILVVIGSTTINTTLTTTTSALVGTIPWDAVHHHWWTFWVGDGVGALEVAPLLFLSWSWFHQHGWRRIVANVRQYPQKLLEFVGCSMLLLCISIVVFCCPRTATIASYPLEYLPFPFVMWAALRFNQWGAIFASCLLAIVAMTGLLQGNGPFIVKADTIQQGTLFLQTFTAAATITALVLAATVAERRQVEAQLRLALAREQLVTTQQELLCQQITALNMSLETQVADRTAQLQARMTELKSFYEMRDMFIQAVSHDLQTSINGTLLILKNLQSGLRGSLQGTADCDLLGRMVLHSERQLTLIQAFSADQLHQEQPLLLQCYPLQLAHLVQKVSQCLAPLLADSQVSLHNHVDDTLPFVIADADKIHMVLVHLLTNAVKHNSPGIQITLAARIEGDYLRCSVVDNGVGIEPDHRSGLFKLYIRSLQNSRRTGIGLGLYLCRQIIQAHGGAIGMEPTPGNGATFWFTLPTRESAAIL